MLSTALTGAQKATKAIYSAVVTGLTGLVAIMVEPEASLGAITQGQWLVIALAVVVAGGGVYGLTNKT